jgi:hypothetical protein
VTQALRLAAFQQRTTAAELIRDAVRESLGLAPLKIRRGVSATIEAPAPEGKAG